MIWYAGLKTLRNKEHDSKVQTMQSDHTVDWQMFLGWTPQWPKVAFLTEFSILSPITIIFLLNSERVVCLPLPTSTLWSGICSVSVCDVFYIHTSLDQFLTILIQFHFVDIMHCFWCCRHILFRMKASQRLCGSPENSVCTPEERQQLILPCSEQQRPDMQTSQSTCTNWDRKYIKKEPT